MREQTIRLNENQLQRLISESVKKVLREGNKGGYPLGVHNDANDEAVGLMYQDYFGKNSGTRDKNRKDVDIINNRTFDELNDNEEITQEIQNFIQSVANKYGISQKRATDIFKGYFNQYHDFFKTDRQAGY